MTKKDTLKMQTILRLNNGKECDMKKDKKEA